jgi:hypothetical protein
LVAQAVVEKIRYMTVESPRIRSLLRQADNVAAVGKRAAAEQLYLQIIDEAPDTAEAWRGLSQVAKSAEERDAAMNRAQELDPDLALADEDLEEPGTAVVSDSEQGEPETGASSISDDGQAIVGQSGVTVSDIALVGSFEEAEQVHKHVYEPSDTEINEVVEQAETLYCANHPGRPTHLRCNRCGKPICSTCANPTPVGYRCPECIREQEDVYFTATPLDYVVAALVTLPLGLVIGWIATLILSSPFGFLLIFLGAFTGSFIGRVAFRVAGRRRGRWLPHLVVICVMIGVILPALPFLLAALQGQFSLRLVFLGIYLFIAAGATFYQMR